jgi:hypothetical protein
MGCVRRTRGIDGGVERAEYTRTSAIRLADG